MGQYALRFCRRLAVRKSPCTTYRRRERNLTMATVAQISDITKSLIDQARSNPDLRARLCTQPRAELSARGV
jgi:hypothetical protein